MCDRPKLAVRLWLLSWLGLISNLIGLLSLGFYKPDYEMDYLCWEVRWCAERARKRQYEKQQ